MTLLRNLSYSLRMLRKNAGMTAAVLVTMALGIGATPLYKQSFTRR